MSTPSESNIPGLIVDLKAIRDSKIIERNVCAVADCHIRILQSSNPETEEHVARDAAAWLTDFWGNMPKPQDIEERAIPDEVLNIPHKTVETVDTTHLLSTLETIEHHMLIDRGIRNAASKHRSKLNELFGSKSSLEEAIVDAANWLTVFEDYMREIPLIVPRAVTNELPKPLTQSQLLDRLGEIARSKNPAHVRAEATHLYRSLLGLDEDAYDAAFNFVQKHTS